MKAQEGVAGAARFAGAGLADDQRVLAGVAHGEGVVRRPFHQHVVEVAAAQAVEESHGRRSCGWRRPGPGLPRRMPKMRRGNYTRQVDMSKAAAVDFMAAAPTGGRT